MTDEEAGGRGRDAGIPPPTPRRLQSFGVPRPAGLAGPGRARFQLPIGFIRQVYEVDPLLCPRCGGTMKVIAVLERPPLVRQILTHLGLPTAAPGLRAPPAPPREWSYEPLFDLPVRRTCLPSRGDRQAQTGDLPIPDPVLA